MRVNTRVVKADRSGIKEAARLIRAGACVGMPTETVYGLAADALSAEAVAGIFRAKDRPADNPLIVHVAQFEQVHALADGFSRNAEVAMRAFWPGALTLVVRRAAGVCQSAAAGLDTLGVRMPDHPAARALILEAGLPIAAPSANRSGKPSPTLASHVLDDMNGRIPLILDGGPCTVGVESTVLDVTGNVPRVLRPGGVTVEMLEAVLGHVEVDERTLRAVENGEAVRSPGMKYRHYAPNAAVTLVEGAGMRELIVKLYDEAVLSGQKALILSSSEHLAFYGTRQALDMGSVQNPKDAAVRLFANLRRADELGAQRVFAEALPLEGIGLAVMNRMLRAAQFNLVVAP